MRRAGRKGIPSPLAGAIALVVLAVGCYFGFTKANPFRGGYEFSAAFRTANDLKAKSPVRVAGVNVGVVTAVEHTKGARGAIVKMRIDDENVIVRDDARLTIRPRIFLEGNWFVDLTPGSPSGRPLDEQATVPVQQTAAPVQFGQLLTALQSDTREDLQVVLHEYGGALTPKGGAAGFNRSIDYWEPAFRDSAIVNNAMLGTEDGDLRGYIRGATRFARGLDRSPEQLKSLITDLAATATAFASEERNLSDAIDELPDTLETGFRALGKLNDAFPPLRRLASDLRPAVRSSGPALDAQIPLMEQLRGLVSEPELKGLTEDLRPTVPDLAELNEGGVPLQKELRLLSSCNTTVISPWRNDTVPDDVFPASGPVFQEQVKWLPGIAAESRNFDANGQYVRSLANGASYVYDGGNGKLFVTGQPLQGVNPPKMGQPPLEADVPCETQQPPDLRTKRSPAPQARRVDWSNPDVRAASDKARERAVEWLSDHLDATGVDIPVRTDDLLRAEIPELPKALP